MSSFFLPSFRRYSPDGEGASWWRRLNKPLDTTSSEFVNASLFQMQFACRSPWGGISELAMNAALAVIEAAAPKDEVEGALDVQMVCTHIAAMAVLAKLDAAFATQLRVAFGSTAARLMRAYAIQVEVLRPLRHSARIAGHRLQTWPAFREAPKIATLRLKLQVDPGISG